MYGLVSGEIWRFDTATGRLIREMVDETEGIYAIAALQSEEFGFADSVYYGNYDGYIRKLGDSDQGVQVRYSI